MSKVSAEKQTEQELLSMAFDYLDAPDLNLSGDAPKTRNVTGTFKLMEEITPSQLPAIGPPIMAPRSKTGVFTDMVLLLNPFGMSNNT